MAAVAEASNTEDSGKGFFSGRSVAFWTIIGSVAAVLSLLVAVLSFLVSTRAPHQLSNKMRPHRSVLVPPLLAWQDPFPLQAARAVS